MRIDFRIECGGKAVLAALLMSTVAACSGTPQVTTGVVSPAVPAGAENFNFRPPSGAAQSYYIRPKDVLTISVVGEPSLSFDEIRVDEDGGFMMPMIGRVQAAEQTVQSITQAITSRLAAKYIRCSPSAPMAQI